jgi:hypothetical protein
MMLCCMSGWLVGRCIGHTAVLQRVTLSLTDVLHACLPLSWSSRHLLSHGSSVSLDTFVKIFVRSDRTLRQHPAKATSEAIRNTELVTRPADRSKAGNTSKY